MEFVAKVFSIKRDNVYKMANAYLASDNNVPGELSVQKNGRGSEKFKQGGADRYSVLKERHLVEITLFVTERNITQ